MTGFSDFHVYLSSDEIILDKGNSDYICMKCEHFVHLYAKTWKGKNDAIGESCFLLTSLTPSCLVDFLCSVLLIVAT